jgi:hypothetical protein
MPNLTINYTQDVDTVYRFVTDPENIKKRCEASGERNVRIEVQEAGGTKTITSTREIDSDLPGFAKKLFSATKEDLQEPHRRRRHAGQDRLQRHHLAQRKRLHVRHRVRSHREGPAHPEEAGSVCRKDHYGGHARRARLQSACAQLGGLTLVRQSASSGMR